MLKKILLLGPLFIVLLLLLMKFRDEKAAVATPVFDTPIYQEAVPELPELDWNTVRAFNLPLNNPPCVPAAEADFLTSTDTVLGVILGEEARAYPWDLLKNFHAVNDYLDGQPIIVNMCEACNGGAAFLATLPETVIDLRPRGLKNGTWYGVDFQTGSLWFPFTGEAFEGPLKGTKLERIRVYFSSWEDWKRDHPDSTVALSSEEVRMRPHGRESHMADPTTFNPAYLKKITSAKKNPRRLLLPGHSLVFGLIPDGAGRPQAFPIDSLAKSGAFVQTKIGDIPILLLSQNRHQIGAYQRRLGGHELRFVMKSRKPLIVLDHRGNRWNMWGRTIDGPDHPSELPLADGYIAKWYEWIENFPESDVIEIK